MSSSAPVTVGGDTTALDAQTTIWFDTFCTGISPFADLMSGGGGSSPQELGQTMTTIGTAFTDTGAKLATLPPPTFEGGQQVADELQANLSQGGPVFTQFGQRALTIAADDQVAGQQFLADFQAATADLAIANFEPTPAVRAAVRQVPSCQAVFGG